MGRKRTWEGQHIHLYIAILILLLSPLACTLSKTADTTMIGIKIRDAKSDEFRNHLALGRKYLAQGQFADALKEHEKVISLAGDNPPADESLFYMAVIYVHPANPGKDFGKSISYFRKLIKDFPQSPLVEQARALLIMLQENDKLNRTVERLNTAVERQNTMVERLNTIIEESKKVDIEIEKRRRTKKK